MLKKFNQTHLHYFHAVKKIFHIFWNLPVPRYFNLALITVQRGQETVDMVRQELQPVCPSCWCGVDCIVFQDVEVTAALRQHMNFICLFLPPRLTVFLAAAGRG
jgi:hypothetical protein